MMPPMRRLAPTLTLVLALLACTPTATTPPTPSQAPRSPAPRATTPAPSTAPAPSATPASPGPTVAATNTPTVRVSAGAPPPGPTPTPTFGPIVAGLRDGGIGRPATEVPWYAVTDLEVDDAGRLQVATFHELRRFAPGGVVERVAGGHRRTVENLAGKAATQAGFRLSEPFSFVLEPDGRTLLADGNRVYRLEADGTLAEVWRGASSEEAWAAVPRSDGGVSLVIASRADADAPRTFAWWTARPGQAAQLTRAASAAEATILTAAQAEGARRFGGRGLRGTGLADELLVRTASGPAWRLSPAGGTPVELDFGADEPTHLDGRGRFYSVSAASGRVTLLTPGGGATPLTARLPANYRIAALASAKDGTVYVAGAVGEAVGAAEQVLSLAGAAPVEVSGAGALPLVPPEGLVLQATGVVAPGAGELLVADALRGQILRLRPGQPAEAAYGKRGGQAPADGAKAADVAFQPGDLGRDGEGRLYLLHAASELYRIEASGTLRRLAAAPTGATFEELAVAPDGTAYVRQAGGTAAGVQRIDGLDARTPVPIGDDQVLGLAVGADGALRLALAAKGDAQERRVRLARWTAADGIEEVDARTRRLSAFSTRSLALDAKGRWWLSLGRAGTPYAILSRFDPASGQTVEVAGRETDALSGDTDDEGLVEALEPVFDPAGDLFFLGAQIRTIPGAGR